MKYKYLHYTYRYVCNLSHPLLQTVSTVKYVPLFAEISNSTSNYLMSHTTTMRKCCHYANLFLRSPAKRLFDENFHLFNDVNGVSHKYLALYICCLKFSHKLLNPKSLLCSRVIKAVQP